MCGHWPATALQKTKAFSTVFRRPSFSQGHRSPQFKPASLPFSNRKPPKPIEPIWISSDAVNRQTANRKLAKKSSNGWSKPEQNANRIDGSSNRRTPPGQSRGNAPKWRGRILNQSTHKRPGKQFNQFENQFAIWKRTGKSNSNRMPCKPNRQTANLSN